MIDQPRCRATSIQNQVTIQGSKAKPKAKNKAKPKSKPEAAHKQKRAKK
jgi:hypothetical protein